MVHSGFGASIVHQILGSLIEITPEHNPVVFDFIFVKVPLLIYSIFKSTREGGMEG